MFQLVWRVLEAVSLSLDVFALASEVRGTWGNTLFHSRSGPGVVGGPKFVSILFLPSQCNTIIYLCELSSVFAICVLAYVCLC